MNFKSTYATDEHGVVLRDKHGPSGIRIKEKSSMSYTDNVEKYRISLWVNATRQGHGYPSKAGNRQRGLMNKLMDYAKRSGINHLQYYSDNQESTDFNIGWAGKRIKAKLKELGRFNMGGKQRKVYRRSLNNMMDYMSLRDFISRRSMVPTTPLNEPLIIERLVSGVLVRNNKSGNVTLFDGHSHIRIEFHQDLTLREDEIFSKWDNLQVIRKWELSSNTVPKPLFKRRPWTNNKIKDI